MLPTGGERREGLVYALGGHVLPENDQEGLGPLELDRASVDSGKCLGAEWTLAGEDGRAPETPIDDISSWPPTCPAGAEQSIRLGDARMGRFGPLQRFAIGASDEEESLSGRGLPKIRRVKDPPVDLEPESFDRLDPRLEILAAARLERTTGTDVDRTPVNELAYVFHDETANAKFREPSNDMLRVRPLLITCGFAATGSGVISASATVMVRCRFLGRAARDVVVRKDVLIGMEVERDG